MKRKTENILRKIHIKDYTNSLEKVLEKKNFSTNTKNLLLSMLYKIENSYNDYEKTKVQVCEKGEFLDKIINIIDKKCNDIISTNNSEQEVKIDKENGSIIALGNELTLLKGILQIGQEKISLAAEENILEPSISYFLNNANLMNELEVIRDFNGWSWDISSKDIENKTINVVFQVIIYLLGYNFVKEWINNSSKLADYLMLMQNKLSEDFGEKRANQIIKIFCKTAIEQNAKRDNEELKFWKNLQTKTQIELEKLENKEKYLEKLTEEKKKITREIEKIDRLMNNQELLKKEYDERNSKLSNKDKIFSVRQLTNKLEIERQEYVNTIKKYNALLEPKGYIKRKDEITKKCDVLNSLNLDSNKNEISEICKLCVLFLECFRIKIIKTAIKQEIIKYIYELRYFRFLMIDNNTSLKEITILSNEFQKTIGVLYEKARTLNAIEDITKDEGANFEIISRIFDSKMIDLNNMVIETKIENGKLYIEYYDTNILENRIELYSNKTIKLNKKTKLFD